MHKARSSDTDVPSSCPESGTGRPAPRHARPLVAAVTWQRRHQVPVSAPGCFTRHTPAVTEHVLMGARSHSLGHPIQELPRLPAEGHRGACWSSRHRAVGGIALPPLAASPSCKAGCFPSVTQPARRHLGQRCLTQFLGILTNLKGWAGLNDPLPMRLSELV